MSDWLPLLAFLFAMATVIATGLVLIAWLTPDDRLAASVATGIVAGVLGCWATATVDELLRRGRS